MASKTPQRKQQKTTSSVQKVTRAVARYWFFTFTVVFYLFFAAYYMGPSFMHCTDRLYGLGDSTAGPVWENGLKPAMPLAGGYENATNYPLGDSLYTPVKYSAVGQAAVLRVTSKIVGPVCGYNMFNVAGYLTTALTMFAFIYYLTKNKWIGLLAGYAVAYTPYAQSKIGGHPGYGFASLLIAVLWLALHTIKRRRLRYGLMLAVALAACMYFDPYFVLLAGTVIGPLAFVWVIYALVKSKSSKVNREESLQTAKIFLIAFGVFVLLIAPLIYIRIHDAHAINATTAASRGNVAITAQQCSNMPLDYLLPDPRNQVLAERISNFTQRNVAHRHWCGFGESRVSISLIAIATITLGIIILAWEKLNKRRLKLSENLSYNPWLLIGSVSAIGAAALLIGLPPHIHGIIMPSDVILKITSTWRIFAREYLVVNMSVIIMFAIILKYFSTIVFSWRKYILPLLYLSIFVLIMFEYQISTPFLPLTFSYKQDTPAVYKQIRDDKAIDVIAEYPMDRMGIEYDSIVYYLTMQTVHQKKLFNSASVTDTRENIHIAMKDITDPQTLPALRGMGVRYVVVHGLTEQEIKSKTDNLQIIGHSNPQIYGLTMVRPGNSNDIYLTKIIDGPETDRILVIQKGFAVNLPLQQNPLDVQFEVVQDAELKVIPLNGKQTNDARLTCFDTKMSATGDSALLDVRVNGEVVQQVQVTDNFTHIEVIAKEGDTILLHTNNGHNMRLNNLGCAQQ